MIFFALKQSLFHRILRKQIILRIKSIHLIMKIFRKFHRRKIKRLRKNDKNYDIFMSPCCHGDGRVNENFHFFKYFTLWQCGHQVPLSQLL